MKVSLRTAVCGFLVAIVLPASALAQSPGFQVWERPAAGLMLGAAANADEGSGNRSADIDFVFDTPVVFGYRVRADASRVGWRYGSRNTPGLPASETVTVKSIRVALLRVRHASPHTAAYAGGGYGVYRFEYARSPLHNPWRGGVHGVAGLEFLSQSQRYAFNAEVRLHAINGTLQPPVLMSTVLKLDGAIGMKVRF
jgi:hypothetical protein